MTDEKTKEFIEKAKKVHGDLYDYSETKYVNSLTKVIIRCSIHNNFTQLPHGHLKGYGCKLCGNKKMGETNMHTINSFIKKATIIHGDEYDYSRTVYTRSADPIKVICKVHGLFTQGSAGAHLSGSGCPQCAYPRKTTDEFIKKAKIVHGETYDYSQTVFVRSNRPLKIICRTHGPFSQMPENHISGGSGCSKCSHKKKTKTQEQFICDAKKIHGDTYDYSSVLYSGSNNKVIIICREEGHGQFAQTANEHLRGRGCKKCGALRQYSKSQIKWMNILEEQFGINIENAENVGEHQIVKSKYKADGYCNDLNIVFEFHGCFWHGCPKCFPDRDEKNTVINKTYEELYIDTCKKEKHCLKEGYKYLEIWECEWKKIKKNDDAKNDYLESIKDMII